MTEADEIKVTEPKQQCVDIIVVVMTLDQNNQVRRRNTKYFNYNKAPAMSKQRAHIAIGKE